MPIYDIFDNTKLYSCPFCKDPITCTCSSCHMRREWEKSSAALKTAESRNFAPLGTSVPSVQSSLQPESIQETTKEKVERQRKERLEQSEKNWVKIQDQQKNTEEFMLGWMQSSATQPQAQLWASLFSSETTESQKQLIKICNEHLNEPVRKGEIVVIPSSKPLKDKDKNLLSELIEEAKIASQELGKLLDAEIATLNRHFELFSYELDKRISEDGMPTTYHAQVSLGVGATAAYVEQHLKNVNNVLLEINDLYVSQVAMASRTGGVNYGSFTAERAELFKKLDGSFSMLSKRSVSLPIYTQVKRNLKLSTKSVVHNADEILKKGYVGNLGKRIANISIGIQAARGLGYIGLTIGAISGLDNIHTACSIEDNGQCEKTVTREVAGFLGGWYGGVQGGSIGVAAALLIVGVTASAPVLAIAAIGGAITGGAIGGIAGSTAGKAAGDAINFIYEWVTE